MRTRHVLGWILLFLAGFFIILGATADDLRVLSIIIAIILVAGGWFTYAKK